MIQEVIVVEGRQDIAAVKRAVEAEVIATGGFALGDRCMERITQAYQKRGIIILTDPDSAGERIRRYLTKKFPDAKHAFVPKAEATACNDIGIERSSPEAIRKALMKVRCQEWQPQEIFTWQDIMDAGLTGRTDASEVRARLGASLGIGYANAKNFLYRLNHYGVTREEFLEAVAALEEENR